MGRFSNEAAPREPAPRRKCSRFGSWSVATRPSPSGGRTSAAHGRCGLQRLRWGDGEVQDGSRSLFVSPPTQPGARVGGDDGEDEVWMGSDDLWLRIYE